MNEELISKYMKTLDLSRDEAIQLIEDDKAVDKGEKLNELTPEQKKVAKKYTSTGTRNTHAETGVYNWKNPRKRKENPIKRLIIAEIFEFLSKNDKISIEIGKITNAERQIAFKVGENSFELTLVQKRPPKK